MSIRHTVVFTLHHAAGSEEERSFLADGPRILQGIPGVTDFVLDRQVSPKSDLVWRFSMTFADEDTYRAYDAHPDHRGFVADRWIPEVARFQEYDFVPVS